VCLDHAKNSIRIEKLIIANEDIEKIVNFRLTHDSKKVMLFRMVEILFGLFVGNNNEELRRTTVIQSSSWNSIIAAILTVLKQQIYV
jgi:hypothetical protein